MTASKAKEFCGGSEEAFNIWVMDAADGLENMVQGALSKEWGIQC